jgi:hypothetical protein
MIVTVGGVVSGSSACAAGAATNRLPTTAAAVANADKRKRDIGNPRLTAERQ